MIRERRPALRAIIFDVDGTLAETERHGHWVACNEAFAELGLPIRWTWDEYRALLRIPGNQNRMRRALAALGTLSEREVEATATELFRVKQRRYLELVPTLQLRPGVRALVDEAVARGVGLAIVSTSSEPQIHALLRHLLAECAHRFDPVLGQQSGAKIGEEGRLYELCLAHLGLPPEAALAIEDAEDGLQAARRAGLTCVVAPSDERRGDDFSGAALVVPTLAGLTLDRLETLLPVAAGGVAGGSLDGS